MRYRFCMSRYASFLLSALVLSLFLAGCSGRQGLLDFLKVGDFESNRVEISHPGGPIRQPDIPPELAEEAAERAAEREVQSAQSFTYKVIVEFSGEIEKDLGKDITKAFKNASLLERLRKSPPDTVAGLEQRMRADLEVARDVLHAYGFYAGDVNGRVRLEPQNIEEEKPRERYLVTINLTPNARYHLGPSIIIVTEESARQAQELEQSDRALLPDTLDDVGLRQGVAVIADEVLDAVNEVRRVFRARGYPHATITSSRYFLDHDTRTLETEIEVDTGERVHMGEMEIRGTTPVKPAYIKVYQNWRQGRLWNQDRIDRFRENLRQTGLFAGVDVYPSEELNAKGERNVVVEVTGALEHTMGGALRWDSDLGPGVLGYWEDRNLTGRGDKLRVEVPVWEELQEVAVSYRLPFFRRNNQDLLISGGGLHEDNDSYKLMTGNFAVGLERRFRRHWSATGRVRVEGGSIEEVDKPERAYYMLGLPLSLTFNDTLNPLDAVRGVRITVSAAPYVGEYDDYFTALRTRVDAHAFLPLVGRDTLVLALRGVYGSLFMEDADVVPPTIRFYSGGGGSVRGYEWRSIGPRNDSRDPLGGDSLVECSLELRWRFAEDWGLVLFTDGGMVYTDKFPNTDDKMLWGAGIGVRYYTVIGPVRFDVATPVNGRNDDSSVQLYISIGQSF